MKNIFLNLFFIISLISYGAAKDPGTTSANFLKIPVGAKATALGGAYTSINKSVYSLYWNPAGITEIKNITLTAMHNSWMEDINYNYIGCVIPFNLFTIGISGSFISMDDIEKTIETVGGYQKTGTFSPKDFALNISIGKKINDQLNIGGTIKYINSKLDNESASAFALDMGIIYKPNIKNLQLGFAIQNLGTKLKYINEKENLPLNITIGAQYTIIDNLVFLTDINKYIDNDIQIHSGLEYTMNIISLRIGYNSLSDLDSGISAGLGVQYDQLILDYAFEPQGDFGDTHRFSITYTFGK